MEGSYRTVGVGKSWKIVLKKLGLDHKMYGLHSLWFGGATSAVSNNPNLLERLLKLHGRWNSDTARDMYVWEDVFKRLQISSRIGL